MSGTKFEYNAAFDRNIGWITGAEQIALRTRRVAIAGMGGVGGVHLETLTRLGIGSFTLADFDRFDIANFNRQLGATIDTVGRPKLDVMIERAQSINPGLNIRAFPEGIAADTIDEFLMGADLFVDGLDFFALPLRRLVFERARALGIPALTAAPLGMGVGFLAFSPGGMTFEEYFRLEGQTDSEQYLRFLIGLAPRGLHRSYLADPSRVSLSEQRGPSTVIGCELCAGVTAAQALRILLHRDRGIAAPIHHQYDAYRAKAATSRLRWGNAGPIQRLRLAVARRFMASLGAPVPAPPAAGTLIETLLGYARWTPSGDNAQPWRFRLDGPNGAEIDFKAGPHGDIYDFRGHEPTTLAAGMLLETLQIAARQHGATLKWSFLGGSRIAVQAALVSETPEPEPLFPFITTRSVDRRRYRTRPLRPDEIEALTAALGPDIRISWHSSLRQRLAVSALGAKATGIRLRAAEAFEVHQRVIDWQNRSSPHGIPAGAVGVDPGTLRLMRWTMKSWGRARLLNRVAGTGAIAAQLDLVPGIGAASFFTLRGPAALQSGDAARIEALLRAGQAVQRFWLTATRLGLAMQPAYATLIFAEYGASDTAFTADPDLRKRASTLAARFRQVIGQEPREVFFIGRIGEPVSRPRKGRSVRRDLEFLTLPAASKPPAASAPG